MIRDIGTFLAAALKIHCLIRLPGDASGGRFSPGEHMMAADAAIRLANQKVLPHLATACPQRL